jgi:hypothetical protein
VGRVDLVECRDPAFWSEVAEHPDVAPHISLGQTVSVDRLIAHPLVTPLRTENGGFFFVRLDGCGRVYDLHTLFRPEAWGTREIVHAARQAFDLMFSCGAQIITTNEVAGNRRSQPPRSFRFAPTGDFAPSAYGPAFRTWFLTKDAWEACPARRR